MARRALGWLYARESFSAAWKAQLPNRGAKSVLIAQWNESPQTLVAQEEPAPHHNPKDQRNDQSRVADAQIGDDGAAHKPGHQNRSQHLRARNEIHNRAYQFDDSDRTSV